nr:RNA methyltransferase [Lachnospiraceae bacterium]
MKTIINELKNNENVRSNLSALRKLIANEGGTEELLSCFSVEELLAFFDSEDAKTRKNAALLAGDLAEGIKQNAESAKKTVEKLVDGYFSDGTLFTKSSYLKALKSFDIEAHKERLKKRSEELMSYVPEENEKKHIAEERHELDILLADETTAKKHRFTGYNLNQEVVLVTNPLFYETLTASLRGIRTRRHPFGIALMTDSLKPILALRFYREILFTLKPERDIFITDQPETIADAVLKGGILEHIKKRHDAENTAPFGFRLELRGAKDIDEAKVLKRIAVELEEGSRYSLKNSTGDYEIIIRLLADRTGKLHVFIKYLTIEDKRFSYRKNTIAASIHPANAALLMQLAAPFMKDDAQVIDPCCGVGTMLVE